MISANVQQQQQQVDNKKATNANYNRKSQINIAQYTQSSNNRNILSENNYYVAKDYSSAVDSSGNQLSSPQTTGSSSANIASNFPAPLSIASNILTVDSKSSANILNEQISALFPKCRPKNDAHLNKTALYIETNSTALASASLLFASSPSNGDYKNRNKHFIVSESSDNTLIDNSRAYTRNMNNQNADASLNDDSNELIQNNISGIGETASRMNHAGYATRLYQHNSNSNYQRNANNQHQSNDYLGGFDGSNQMTKMHQKWESSSNDLRKWTESDDFMRDGNIWEKRRRTPNTTPASTVLNSPDFNEMHHYSHNPVQHQIKVGRSPVNQHENKEKNATSPVSPIQSHQRSSTKRPATLVSDGEIVVFDDIDNWRNQNEKHFPSQNKASHQQNNSTSKSQSSYRFNHMLLDDDDDDERDSNTNSFSTDNVTKMIEYEGSPRRFGHYQQDLPLHQYQYTSTTNQQHFDRPPSSRKMLTSPTLFPPRPGFPKRITTSPSNASINGSTNEEAKDKCSNATGFEYQNNALNKCSPSVSPTQVTSTPNIPNKQVATCDSTSPTNSQAVPISSQNSPSSPSKNERSATVSENNTKTTPNYTDRINLLGNHLPSTTLSNNANRSSFTTTAPNTTTFDYLYEFSETRKVLEDFFKCPTNDEEKKIADCFNESDTGSLENLNEIDEKNMDANYIGQRLAKVPTTNNKDYNNTSSYQSPKSRYANNYTHQQSDEYENNDVELYLDSNSRSSGELADTELEMNQQRRYSRHFTLSPETTDYDSNCGDLDSLSNDLNGCIGMNSHCLTGSGLNSSSGVIPDYSRLYTSMPVLEDGLSSGHASDTENNNPVPYTANNISTTANNTTNSSAQINNIFDNKYIASNINSMGKMLNPTPVSSIANTTNNTSNAVQSNNINLIDVLSPTIETTSNKEPDVQNGIEISTIGQPQPSSLLQQQQPIKEEKHVDISSKSYLDSDISSIFSNPPLAQISTTHNNVNVSSYHEDHIEIVQSTLKDIRSSIQQSKTLQPTASQQQLQPQQQQQQQQHEEEKKPMKNDKNSPIWLPRHHHNQHNQSHESLNSDHNISKPLSVDDEEADTDLETDRLLGQQRLDDHGFYDDKSSTNWCDRPSRLIKSPSASLSSKTMQQQQHHAQTFSSASIRQGIGTSSGVSAACANNSSNSSSSPPNPQSSNQHLPKNPSVSNQNENKDSSTSPNKSQLSKIQKSPSDSQSSKNETEKNRSGKSRNKEGRYWEPAVLIEGVLFRARYLGSTQLVCEGQPTKSTRMMQAEEAVSRIKALAPEGESQPSTEVDLFISTEKIMVLNTDLKEIMMDHALRTISYIADIGDLVVLMARRRFVPSDSDDGPKLNRTPKMICHVFESDEAQFIAQSIGQAFQVAYMEFLKANGIEDHSFVKEMDYQEVLNSQEIFGDELEIFAKKELQKEVVVPKTKGEILGMILIESGWGSMLPTVVIANLLSTGAAARCGQLNIGDQIIAINGLSLVGLPLSTCQTYIRNTKTQTAVKFTVVPCPPVVEVKIKRPNTKYQLGFSVQNGVICSLLRGGIAERGGVRVGHRIIEINNQSVVAVPHEKIVNLLATSVGEILMKTMPTSMFRLLTGQENPIYI
ncbi:dentin sialophosphoprotein isoform X4 [Contarinia nasturtii]|uniref:dentin sialophosphoprotein isoform X4 n=1 Tax=Contarinia nasturtii TaxID=265458 RepID=UPI0012D3F677|nr:dentin sialophosphoprotein isoform X4 [Contarinia nasturtii]